MIRLENVTKYYKSNDLIAVGIRKINLDFKIGEFVAITGESGSGKSTLLNILSGLDTFEEGEFFLNEEKTSHYSLSEWETYRATHVGFVFQNYNIIDSYTVYQNVLIALEFQGYDQKTRKERAIELIEKVGLSHRTHHKASKLSGGEKQRTVIARALAKDCKMILCDEPTGNLDSKTAKDILKLLHDISQDKLVIIVTHNYDDVKDYVTRRIKMSDGEIVEDIDLKKVKNKKYDKIEQKNKKVDFTTTLGISMRNIISTPKRLIFFLLLQAVFVFLVFLIYGTISSLAYQNQIIPGSINASTHQIVVQKSNFEPFTLDEIQQVSKNRLIKDVELNESVRTFFSASGRRLIFSEKMNVLKQADLSKGRFPNQMNEVIISEDLKLFLNTDVSNEIELISKSGDSYIYLVTGISKNINSSVYFHHDFFENEEIIFKSFIQETNIHVIDESFPNIFKNSYVMVYEDPLLSVNSARAEIFDPSKIGTRDATINITSGYNDRYDLDLSVNFVWSESSKKVFVDSITYQYLIDTIIEDQPTYKVVLSVYDQYDGARVVKSLDHQNYIVFYNILTPNTDSSTFGTLLKLISYVAIIFVALFIFTILRFVFKNMVKTRRKDFAIFRSVGANKNFLGYLIVLEQLIQIFIGTILTVFVIGILALLFQSIENTMKYINLLDVLVVFIVFSYMTIRTPMIYNKQIFEISVIDTLRSSTEV
jgi:putative ABC transport system permease protein